MSTLGDDRWRLAEGSTANNHSGRAFRAVGNFTCGEGASKVEPRLRSRSSSTDMCGIVGLMMSGAHRADALEDLARRMSTLIAYRGPDDSGVWSEPSGGVALGFRRLSIIDLSSAGHQPMRSATGRFTMVFNGEVYNYREISAELAAQGQRFRGHSDTEVILAAFERWGIAEAVQRFIGMFAIAVWDAHTRRLSLIRDRLGIKPLYYYQRSGVVLFASELKAFTAFPGFDRTLDDAAIEDYLRYLCVPAPRTIFRHSRKLLPGHILTIADPVADVPPSEAYWSADDVYKAAVADPFAGSDDEAVDELNAVLSDAVKLRMRADVPMGALLSGGVDSSVVVALMQANASQPTRTFSIGFPGTEHDEGEHAAQVARALGTDHTPMDVTGDDALDVVPRLAELFDEPFADPSQIPTYLVSQLARRHVTVALTGDGGDELFAGYERYVKGEQLMRRLVRMPRPVRQVVGAGIGTVSAQSWDTAYRSVASVIGGGRQRLAGEKIRKLGNLLSQESESLMYRSLLSALQDPDTYLARPAATPSRVDDLLRASEELPLLDRMMLVDQRTYLADDLLAKVDRASMAVSLEARVPILDHRVVRLAWRMPRRFKVRNGRGKWLLRQLLYRNVDRQLVDRPKVGFSVPIAAWLRGPLREWAADVLFSPNASRAQHLRMDRVRTTWDRFQSRRDDSALGLWALVMYKSWESRWLT
jgi:asparagine synthase (glutamine-hydrolysing)